MELLEAKLKKAFLEALNKIAPNNLKENDIIIEIPKDNKNGDYASNVALKNSKTLQLKPRDLALKIQEVFDYAGVNVEKIEIAGPGFINLFMNKENLAASISAIIDLKDDYGQWPLQEHPRINVEYVSANPTGDLHLGHARQACLGDSITRMYKKAGFNVISEYYINDAGKQIDNLAKSVICRYHQLFDIASEMPNDGYHGQDIKDIALLIKNLVNDKYLHDGSAEAYQYFKKTALQFELDKLKRDLKDFNVEFDIWTSEQKLYDEDKVNIALTILKNRGATYEKDGALWLKSKDYGDDKDRVLIKKDGCLTYLMPDIANHMQKLENGADFMVDLWGADHHGYIKRMKIALEIFTGKKNLLDVDIVQMVRLIKEGVEVKMSKRSGNAIGLRELCEEVGNDAVRYFFASRAGSSHFDFDLGLATSQSNDNPVYYAQYAHARICSILALADELTIQDLDAALLNNNKEIGLIKHINDFPNVIMDAAKQRAPHRMTNYIHKLASLFHSYYNECKVIDKANMPLTSARVHLLKACKITLANALALIGIKAVDKM